MKDVLQPMWWQMLLENLEFWWFDQVLVPSNLVQLVLILAIFLLARLQARPFRRGLGKFRQASSRIPAFARIHAAFTSVAVSLPWLVMQWLAIATAQQAGWPHALLNTTASLLSAWVAIRLLSHWVENPLWSRILASGAWTLAAPVMIRC